VDLQTQMKAEVARVAAQQVESGMILGLGSGSTAAILIEELGKRWQSGDLTDIKGVPTSFQASVLAQQYGIPLITLNEIDHMDLAIDGADEVDPQLNLIKGGGGALLREKIVASLSRRVAIIVDSQKQVSRLGAFPLPVEVVQFAWRPLAQRLGDLGATPVLRLGPDGGAYVTDEGNFVLDCAFGRIDDPAALAARLDAMPGVVDHGLFVGLAHTLVVGRGDGTVVLERNA